MLVAIYDNGSAEVQKDSYALSSPGSAEQKSMILMHSIKTDLPVHLELMKTRFNR